MRRGERPTSICRRCGSVNPASAEVCAGCGLQLAWLPRPPHWLRFWRWSPPAKWRAGALSAPLAFVAETYLALDLIAALLIGTSVLTLLWTLGQTGPSTGSPQG